MAKKKLVEQEHNGMDLVEDDGFITIDTNNMNDTTLGHTDMSPEWVYTDALGGIYDEPCTIEYKFNEKNLLNEMQDYIDATYNQHYAKNKFQATEFICCEKTF